MTDIAPAPVSTPAPAPAPEPAPAPPALAPAPAPAAEPQPQAQPPAQQGFVDLSGIQDPALRSQIQQRFNYFMWDSRTKDEALRKLGEHNLSLEKRFNEFEVKDQQAKAGQQLATLRSQHTEALQRGDYDAATRTMEQITRLTAAPAPRPVAPRPAAPVMSQEEVASVAKWAQARDAGGNPLRPWAQPGHDKYAEGLKTLQDVSTDPLFVNAPTATLLHEVERRMTASAPAPQPRPSGSAAVLGSGNVRPPAQSDAPLTEDQKRVAVNMFLKSGLVKTPQEAHDRYKNQLRLMGR